MTATTAMRAELRRMIDEPEEATYDDDALDLYIERYPAIDVLGTTPVKVDYSTEPPTLSVKDEWIPTYDLHAAAADIWLEKSATVAEDYTVTADGSTLKRSDVQKQYKEQSRIHRGRRKPGTVTLRVEPRTSLDTEGVVND